MTGTNPTHIVVVAYNGADMLDRCLATIGGAGLTTVVDNSSSADVRSVAQRHDVEYVDPGRNLGFGAGANVVLSRISPDAQQDVLLLNPDALLTPDDLRQLQDFMHRDDNHLLAAVSPRLRTANGHEHQVSWPFPTPYRAWLEAIGLGVFPARHTFVVGAVLLLRSAAIRDVGVFDEEFFLYAEETDWQRRAYLAGWRSAICEEVIACHVGAATSTDPLRREMLFHAAQELYIRKWYGPLGWWIYRVAAFGGAAGRALVLRTERGTSAAARAKLYFRGPRKMLAALRD